MTPTQRALKVGDTNGSASPSLAETSDRDLLISLRPRFADALLDGAKTIELRRRVPASIPGSRILLYSSTPTCAIIGTAVLGSIHRGEASAIWKSHGRYAAVTREEFDHYFAGSAMAYALEIRSATAAPFPLELERMRRDFALRPPQSWRYLPSATATQIYAELGADLDLHPRVGTRSSRLGVPSEVAGHVGSLGSDVWRRLTALR